MSLINIDVYRDKLLRGIAQCKVTYVHQWTSTFTLAKELPAELMLVHDVREYFQRDDAVDERTRNAMAALIMTKEQEYSADEEAHIKTVTDLCAYAEKDYKEIKTDDPHVVLRRAADRSSTSSIGVIEVRFMVSVGVTVCAAFDLLRSSRQDINEFVSTKGGVESECPERAASACEGRAS